MSVGILQFLSFTGPLRKESTLEFDAGLNLVFGASNAGKSYAVKAIDFMLGGNKTLPEISESNGYDRVWLGLDLPILGGCTLARAMAGGAYEVNEAHRQSANELSNSRMSLSARHDSTDNDNLSQFLLNEFGYGRKFIAKDVKGAKRSLSFRDVVRFCIVDETSIQSETSPAETGQYTTVTSERSTLKLLLTGVDDSAIQPIEDKKIFATRTTAKVEIIDEMLANIGEELAADFPDVGDLENQNDKLEETFSELQEKVQVGRHSIRALLGRKRDLAGAILERQRRAAEIDYNLARFEQLKNVYQSDASRLETLEEAGFLLMVGSDKNCALCGAPPESQKHEHGIAEIEKVREAALAEIRKITRQRAELQSTIDQLREEEISLVGIMGDQDNKLEELEAELSRLAPEADNSQRQLEELTKIRDRVQRGRSLLSRRNDLSLRKVELVKMKPASAGEKPKLGVSSPIAHDFAQAVSKVLEEWQFPGKRHVSFDEGTYDLKIDGKHRRDNGKGVRAITHAAFKVALMLYCHERNLPHPGFVILDTPLLTYRDPLAKGPLSSDEQALANTSLKDFFFEHLASLKDIGQFIVFENLDPPSGINRLANVQAFTGQKDAGREGLFVNS